MNKRIIAAVLSLLMCLPVFSACSNRTPEPPEETSAAVGNPDPQPGNDSVSEETETEAPELDDGLGSPDFEGYDFRILSCFFNDLDTWRYLLCDEITGTPLNDQLYETKDNLETRFNIKFTMIEPGNDETAQRTFVSSVTGDDNAFDLHIGKDWRTCDLGVKGYCHNLFDVEQFDFTKPWWPYETVRQLSVGKKLFAASNYASYCGIHWTRVMTFNKDLLADVGIDAPYETVREGAWTLDKLYGLTHGLSIDANGNGVLDKSDTIALLGYDHTYYCLQEAAAVSAHARDEENIPYLNIDVERIDGYVQKMRALLTEGDYLNAGGQPTLFADGKTVFAFCEIRDAYNTYRASEIRYGFLPQPKYDELQEKYIACCTDTPWALPKTFTPDQAEIAGTVIEAMSAYNYKNMLPVYLESTLKSRLADEPDDSVLCADEKDGMVFKVLTSDLRISRCIDFQKISVGSLVVIGFWEPIRIEEGNTVSGAVSMVTGSLYEGEVVIPE